MCSDSTVPKLIDVTGTLLLRYFGTARSKFGAGTRAFDVFITGFDSNFYGTATSLNQYNYTQKFVYNLLRALL